MIPNEPSMANSTITLSEFPRRLKIIPGNVFDGLETGVDVLCCRIGSGCYPQDG